MNIKLFPLLLALLPVTTAPQARAGPPREAPQKKRVAALKAGPEPRAASLPAGNRMLAGLPYGSDPQQRLDVYLPKKPENSPVIFMVHGGAWMYGDKGSEKFIGHKTGRWLPKGYALVSINYRMSRSPDPLQQADDAARALAYVQARCGEWGCDPARVLLLGHSAGAHLVSLLSAAPDIASAHGALPWLGTVSLDSAMMNVPGIMEKKHYRFYDRVFGKDRKFWEAASPYHRLEKAPRPMLLVCSANREESCPQAESFARKAVSLGGRAEVLAVKMSHGALNADLGLPGEYTAGVEAFMRSLGLP